MEKSLVNPSTFCAVDPHTKKDDIFKTRNVVNVKENCLLDSFYVIQFHSNNSTNKMQQLDCDQQPSSRFSPTVKPEAPSAVVCSWWWEGRSPKHVEPHI